MRILAIDDDPLNLRVLRCMLSVAGVEMLEATDAESGLAILDERKLDAILLDLRMPGIDGMEATGRIRARDDRIADVPIVIVTADTGFHVRGDCLAAGADAVLRKPVEMTELFGAIGDCFARRSVPV